MTNRSSRVNKGVLQKTGGSFGRGSGKIMEDHNEPHKGSIEPDSKKVIKVTFCKQDSLHTIEKAFKEVSGEKEKNGTKMLVAKV